VVVLDLLLDCPSCAAAALSVHRRSPQRTTSLDHASTLEVVDNAAWAARRGGSLLRRLLVFARPGGLFAVLVA
jgi:hypothetical protein